MPQPMGNCLVHASIRIYPIVCKVMLHSVPSEPAFFAGCADIVLKTDELKHDRSIRPA